MRNKKKQMNKAKTRIDKENWFYKYNWQNSFSSRYFCLETVIDYCMWCECELWFWRECVPLNSNWMKFVEYTTFYDRPYGANCAPHIISINTVICNVYMRQMFHIFYHIRIRTRIYNTYYILQTTEI